MFVKLTYRGGERHRLYRALVHIQFLKTQHGLISASGDRDFVAVAVADNAHAHAQVHQHARRVYDYFRRGDRVRAEQAYAEMSAASEEVLLLLTQLERG